MSFYAEWDYKTYAPNVLRMKTRIYWGDGTFTQEQGKCVGTFIGENPGGAMARQKNSGWDVLVDSRSSSLDGDRTLRFIYDVWQGALKICNIKPATNDYIEILNTYYFRCTTSGEMLPCWKNKCRENGGDIYFQGVNSESRFVLLGWGRDMHESSECKTLLDTIPAEKRIIYALTNGEVRSVLKKEYVMERDLFPAQPTWILRNKSRNEKYLLKLSAIIAECYCPL